MLRNFVLIRVSAAISAKETPLSSRSFFRSFNKDEFDIISFHDIYNFAVLILTPSQVY